MKILLLALCVATGLAAAAPSAPWIPLFDGRTLTGWRPVNVSPDTFVVQDGVIVCRGAPDGFLISEQRYENFVLELEWRHLKPRGNSGILIWADELPAPGAPYPRATEVQVLDPAFAEGRANAGRGFTAHGDIMGIRGATIRPVGRISENGRRSLAKEERVKPSPEWNHYRVECRDGVIELSVNGALVTRAEDVTPHSGYIGLQSEGGEIHFRNIRILPLPSKTSAENIPDTAGFRSIFNGENFDGWKTSNPKILDVWSIHKGVISSKAKVLGKDLHLWTARTYRDYDLIVDWRMPAKPVPRSRATFTEDGLLKLDEAGQQIRRDIDDAGDSGIFLREDQLYQVNLWSQPMGSGDINELHKDAKLPAALRRAMLPLKKADKPSGEWNRFLLKVRGDRVAVWLNGELVIPEVALPGMAHEGPIGLQYHRDNLEFRNVFIREVPSATK